MEGLSPESGLDGAGQRPFEVRDFGPQHADQRLAAPVLLRRQTRAYRMSQRQPQDEPMAQYCTTNETQSRLEAEQTLQSAQARGIQKGRKP
jgi:hypothetical protein